MKITSLSMALCATIFTLRLLRYRTLFSLGSLQGLLYRGCCRLATIILLDNFLDNTSILLPPLSYGALLCNLQLFLRLLALDDASTNIETSTLLRIAAAKALISKCSRSVFIGSQRMILPTSALIELLHLIETFL